MKNTQIMGSIKMGYLLFTQSFNDYPFESLRVIVGVTKMDLFIPNDILEIVSMY